MTKVSWNASYPKGTNKETWGDFLEMMSETHPAIRDDDAANDPEGLAATSSRGTPPGTRRIKPASSPMWLRRGPASLSAQSSHLNLPAGEVFREVEGMSHDPKWWFATGTSMATPLVAGCCAVINRSCIFHRQDSHYVAVAVPCNLTFQPRTCQPIRTAQVCGCGG